jgi:hypothetical protein
MARIAVTVDHTWYILVCWMPRFTAYLCYLVLSCVKSAAVSSSFRVANLSNSSALCADPLGKRLDAEVLAVMAQTDYSIATLWKYSIARRRLLYALKPRIRFLTIIHLFHEAWSTNPWAARDQSHQSQTQKHTDVFNQRFAQCLQPLFGTQNARICSVCFAWESCANSFETTPLLKVECRQCRLYFVCRCFYFWALWGHGHFWYSFTLPQCHLFGH